MLTHGLDILRVLAEAPEPLTATAIAERVGLHVSNVSRTLRVLADAGYVRKPTYHSFAPDLGTLALAGAASMRLPEISKTRDLVRDAARKAGAQASLATLFRGQILYLHQCEPGSEPKSAISGGFPLHRSVVGLRLLLDMPGEEAVGALEAGRHRYGWERPTPQTPEDPVGCLAAARKRLRQDGLLPLHHWDAPGACAVALPVAAGGHAPMAVGLNGGIPASTTLRQAEDAFSENLTALAAEIRSRLTI